MNGTYFGLCKVDRICLLQTLKSVSHTYFVLCGSLGPGFGRDIPLNPDGKHNCYLLTRALSLFVTIYGTVDDIT